MILDELTEFADGAACTGSAAATVVVGDVIDVGTALRNLGVGESLWLIARIVTGIVAAGAGTVRFKLVTADNAALTSNAVTLAQTDALVTQASTPAAGVAAGVVLFAQQLPSYQPTSSTGYKQFLGITVDIVSNNVSAGAIDAFLTMDPALWKPYADAI